MRGHSGSVGTTTAAAADKLFLEIAGKPVVGHTWLRFDQHPCIDALVIVVRPGMESTFSELACRLPLRKPFHLITGGTERQDSVWNGFQSLPEGTRLVAIQDGARPCTSRRTIEDTLRAASAHGAAVAAQRVTDTIKQSADGQWIQSTLDRSRLWAVQTPQCFRVEVIKAALAEARARGVVLTDDTAACELVGHRVRLVECDAPNPKVTRPADLAGIEALLCCGGLGATATPSEPHA
jgi:2-C-methyl-D-erythritol 4-phosphate cytidylyltransferase